jgi:F420-dependent oxidoreductase-like protein
MPDGTIGVTIQAPDAAGIVDGIVRAEQMGVPAVWMTAGGTTHESLTMFAAAAARTERILLGTAIVPTYPRHPIVTVAQTMTVASLAPGRFRLGVGPSHKRGIEGVYGIPFTRPLAHLRAYIAVLKGLLHDGAADVDEAGVVAHTRLTGPPPGVPVMASALQRRSFELCGEIADGAITWLCPEAYVRDVGLPAVRAGAERAGRPTPPLVMHVPVAVQEDVTAVREAVRASFSFYLTTISYPEMLAAAGFPEVKEGQWSDAMVDAVVAHGSEEQVGDRLRALFAIGVNEIIAQPVAAGTDTAASIERTLRLVADLAKSPA